MHSIEIGENKEPFQEMDPEGVREAVRTALDTSQRPLLVVCISGIERTGCVVACVRKQQQQWALTASIDEYSRFLGTKTANLLDLQFIESYRD